MTPHQPQCGPTRANRASEKALPRYDWPLVVGKAYRVVPDARAAKDNLVRIIDESGEDDLFARSQFVFVEFPQAVRRKILALQRAS